MDTDRKQKEMQNMKRIQEIYHHPLFQECLEKNREAEEMRVFCRHDMNHFLDVARLAYIFSMERDYKIAKKEIYAAALLHDIGKWMQYKDGTPHEKASAKIAEKILSQTGFAEEERKRILESILSHRKREAEGQKNSALLAEIIYDADKISRVCFACPVEGDCNWECGKKNMDIIW